MFLENFVKFLPDFLRCRKQKLLLNGQHFFLEICQRRSCTVFYHRTIIISNLSKAFLSNGAFPNCKLFADGFSLFSVVSDIQASITTLSYEPTVVSKWTFQWKKIFILDLTKQSQQVTFVRENKKLLHPTLLFNTLL